MFKFALFFSKKILNTNDKKNRLTQPVIQIAVWGIGIGVLIMLMAVSITHGYQKEIKFKLSAFNGDVQISKAAFDDAFESAPLTFDSLFYNSIQQDLNITHIQSYAYKAGIIKTEKDIHGVVLKGVDTNFNWEFFNTTIIEGTGICFDSLYQKPSQDLIISKYIADLLDLSLNDKIRIFFVTQNTLNGQETIKHKKYSFTIKGIYQTGLSEYFDNKMLIIDIKRIQKINQWNTQTIGGYELFFEKEKTGYLPKNSYNEYAAMEEYLNNQYFTYLSFLDTKSIFNRYQQVMYWLDYINIHIYTILIIILIVSIINMSSALLIIILEKTSMIGILKSLGANNLTIRWIFVLQAAYLIGKGILYGNILAFIIAYLQNTYHFIKLDPNTYYITHVTLEVNLLHWLGVNLLTITACSLMLLIPSYVITKISPIKAIKFT